MLTLAASAAAAPLARVCYLSFRAKKRGELSYSVVILSRVIDCTPRLLPCFSCEKTGEDLVSIVLGNTSPRLVFHEGGLRPT